MFSHIVIFWTKPERPGAVDELVAGAERYLRPIPGVVHFEVGRMVPSPRDVVDQSYQVGLTLVFKTKADHDVYQVHPQHFEFVDKVFRPTCQKVRIFDFA